MPTFSLKKYYMDCMDADGNACIFYHADAKIGVFPLSYSSALFTDGDSVSQYGRISKRAPQISESKISFKAPKGVAAEWDFDKSKSFSRLLADGNGMKIKWECISPNAKCVMNTGKTGAGYLERLELEMEEISFPFKELIWGRFISADHTLVWIKWSKGLERNLVFLDGLEMEGEITEDGIAGKNFTFKLSPYLKLRVGLLKDNVFKGLLASVLPKGIGGIYENKELCTGTLHFGGREINGRAIKEIVIL